MDDTINIQQLQESEFNTYACHQNGKKSTTLVPGENGFLLYKRESRFRLDSHLHENE